MFHRYKSDVAVFCIIAFVIVVITCGFVKAARNEGHTCTSNLKQIGSALGMYLNDNDETFPPAYAAQYDDDAIRSYAWDKPLDLYIKSGISPSAGWAFVDSWDNVVVPTDGLLTATGQPRYPWHCPDDGSTEPLSYGVNPMVSGAFKVFHNHAVDYHYVRAQEWQSSLSAANIDNPSVIVWAGDTNRLWDGKHKKYTDVFPEWPRRTDCYLRDMTHNQFIAWYSHYLKRNLTDYSGTCPYPLAWGCRAPAYRSPLGGGAYATTMLFCDGHVRQIPFGRLGIQNIFPSHSVLSSKQNVAAASGISYSIIPIKSRTVYTGMHSGGMNNHGDVFGGNYWDMIAWSNGQASDTGVRGIGYGVNDHGVMVGDGPNGAVSIINGKAVPLTVPNGYTRTAARAINDAGQVVGSAHNAADHDHACLWQNGVFRDLGVPPGCVSSRARAINNIGEVVGSAITEDKHTHAFLWHDGVIHDLGTLPGGSLSIASSVNDRGQIVGDSDTGKSKGFLFHPFLWENGKMHDLGLPKGYRYCAARAINNNGVVVCAATDLDHVPISPLIWTKSSGMRRLDTLYPFDSGWLLRDAYAINNNGQILCWGFYHDTMSLALLSLKHPT